MRFAYIDSQGNEVAIPSVDALALRIELGAIGAQTQLYDAQADRWGPAESHEIFHALSRDVGGEAFLVPAPPAPPPEDESAAPPATEAPPTSATPPPSDDTLGLTLTPEQEGAAEEPGGPDVREDASARAASETAGAFDTFEFSLVDPEEETAAGPATDETEPQSEELRFDAPAEQASRDHSGRDETDGPAEEPPLSFAGGFGDGGFELETPIEFASGAEDAEALEVDGPMAAFEPTGPPAWMEQDGPEGAPDAAMDFSAPAESESRERVADAVPARAERPASAGAGPRRSIPRRPPPRRARRSGGLGRVVVGLVALVAVGAGGYYGWDRYGDRLRPEPARPPVTIPAIPPELEAPMRSLAAAAIPAMFDEIETEALGEDFPGEPSEDWLAGVYLANATRFGQVETFWSGIGRFAERLEALEVETFHERYRALADSADLGEGERTLIVERADSGFLATRDRRVQSYRLLGRLAASALVLHDFLLDNESAIAYTPATAFSGNPVEEAVPATDELGDQMWDLVEDITNAMDALGTLDRVTRERLSGVLLRRVTEIGIE